jgi:beta-lactamase superfamily II metal-dependent hydrolase
MIRPLLLALALLLPAAAADLRIHFVDVEGGQATLIVTPSGESLLVDAGWPGFNGRDADRITAAARQAGLKQIDYLLVTHYHLDHVGGVAPLVEKFPVRHFVDHGDNTETGRGAEGLSASYEKARAAGKRITVKPGDKIPLKGVDLQVVAARGEKIASATPGAGKPNDACAAAQPKDPDPSENGRSIGFILRYGDFRFADLADLTWNKELELVCPNNLIGNASVYLVSHHGMNISNAPPLVAALKPRVAILNAGARKGGSGDAMDWIRKTPGLEDLWQLHFALGAKEANAPEQFIANMEQACQGHGIELTAQKNGSFTVTNLRNGFKKTYKK